MRAIVVGAVESTSVTLRTVAAAPGWRVVAVVTLPPALAARHSDFVDLGPEAAATGARVIHAADVNAPDVLDEIRAVAPDHVFVVGWSQVCGPALLEVARRGAIGFHPAPLPRLRGRAVIPWTILLDEKITGSTLFWIDRGVDTGPIVAQRFFHVAPDETAASLYRRHVAVLVDLLGETLPRLADGTAPRVPQDERCATWCARRTAEDGQVDWARPAVEVWRLVRAVGRPYPGAFTLAPGGYRLILWRASLCVQDGPTRLAAMPGQVVARDATGFVVRCGDGRDVVVEEFAWEAGSTGANQFAGGEPRPPRLHARLGTG
jgi:methionyl-tRNA formyltransferase